MAGYYFEFNSKTSCRAKVRDFLNYIKSIHREKELVLSYKTSIVKGDLLKVCVSVDGPLPAMQFLYRQLPIIIKHYLHTISERKSFVKLFIIPFFSAYEEGVNNITNSIFEISDMFNCMPNPYVVSNTLIKKAKATGKNSRESHAIEGIIFASDAWFDGRMRKKDIVIICDQSMEDWLKFLLTLPKNSRKGFNDVLSDAYNQGLITKMERYRLKVYHNSRNRIQHRNGVIRNCTVDKMIKFYIHTLEKYSGRKKDKK